MVITHQPEAVLAYYPRGKTEYRIHESFHIHTEIFLLISFSQTFSLQSLDLCL